MSEESIFLDESGDFGSNSKYYLVTLVFHNQDKPIEDISKKPSGRERMAYEVAAECGRVTTKALADAAGVGRQTASSTLKAMARRGLLVWHGHGVNDPSQYYTVQ